MIPTSSVPPTGNERVNGISDGTFHIILCLYITFGSELSVQCVFGINPQA